LKNVFRNLMGGPEDPNPANAGPPGPAESVNEVVDFGPEVRMGDDWFEIRGRRFARRGPEPVTPERSFLPEQPGAGDAAAAAPARDEVFLHLTPHMVDVLERIADIDDNERLGTFVLLSGPTGCGKTTLAKTYCHISNQPLTELNFSGDTTLADFFRRTEVVTDDAGNQSTLAGLGPAARAMLLGRKLIVNEINMLPPDLISVITHAMDTGRLLLSGTEFGNIEIELHERFGIIATANPNYVGTAEMGRSLQRRFGLGLGNVPVAFLPPAEETESLLVEFARHPVMQLLGADADSGLGGRLVTLADSLRNHPDVGAQMRDRVSTRTLVHWLSLGQLTDLPLAEIGERAVLTISPPAVREQVVQIAGSALGNVRLGRGKRDARDLLLGNDLPDHGEAVAVPTAATTETPDVPVDEDGERIELPSGRVAMLGRGEHGTPRLHAYDSDGRPSSDLADVRAELRRERGINFPMPLGHVPGRGEILPCLTQTSWTATRLTQATLLLNRPVFLRGPTGTGKSALARTVAHLWGLPTVEFAFTGETAKSDLTAVRQLSHGATRWSLQAFLEAVRDGLFVIVNEYNTAYPDVHSIINGLFDKAELVTLPDGTEIRAHPDFRLVATGFPDGPGVKPLNEGVENRFGAIVAFDYPPHEEERAILEFVVGGRVSADALGGMAELASIARAILRGEIDVEFGGGMANVAPDVAASVAERTALTTAEMVTLARGARTNEEMVAWYRRGVLENTSPEVARVLDPVLANYSLG
jgi:MoxR-like ATPase